MKILFLLIPSLLWTSLSLAADSATSSFSIESLRVSDSTGITYINPVGALAVKNTSCTSTDLYAIKNTEKNTTYDAMYSTLLSAAISGKDVKVWISTDTDDCHNDRQRISVVEIIF